MSTAKHSRSRPSVLAGLFLRDDRGVAAIEFAAVASVSVMLIIGTVELALQMIVDASVQAAAQEASRIGMTMTAPATGTRMQAAQATVNNILDGWKNLGATIALTPLDYGTYSNLANSAYVPTVDVGGYGDVVVYNLKLTMPGITGISHLFGVDELNFERNYVVQNEK